MGRLRIHKKSSTTPKQRIRMDVTIEILQHHIKDLEESGATEKPRYAMAVQAIKSAIELIEKLGARKIEKPTPEPEPSRIILP